MHQCVQKLFMYRFERQVSLRFAKWKTIISQEGKAVEIAQGMEASLETLNC